MLTIASRLDVMNRLGRAMADPTRSRILMSLLDSPSHPAVLEVAVIAIPHDKWGEVPKAFVTLKTDASATEADILDHCRARLAKFKVPHAIEFGALPKTSTGKIQKFVLREREWQDKQKRIN